MYVISIKVFIESIYIPKTIIKRKKKNIRNMIFTALRNLPRIN